MSLIVLNAYTKFLVIKGPFGWRSGKVEGWKISERMEKWEDKKDLVFSRVFGWRGEKVRGWKTFLFDWR